MRTALLLAVLVAALVAGGCELRITHTHTHAGQLRHQHDHEVHRGRRHPEGGVLTPGQARRHERRAARRARWGE